MGLWCRALTLASHRLLRKSYQGRQDRVMMSSSHTGSSLRELSCSSGACHRPCDPNTIVLIGDLCQG